MTSLGEVKGLTNANTSILDLKKIIGENNYIEIPNNTNCDLSILDEYYINNIIKFDRKKYRTGVLQIKMVI